MSEKKATLWSESRRPRSGQEKAQSTATTAAVDDSDKLSWRSVFQQDYDRLLFSTPVRRLSDKTQVWPMDDNDGVRTRLTHSHEVANLARSLGSRIATQEATLFDADLNHVIQPILWAIGLAHDLGNPPFGHQGEAAMGRWFEDRDSWIFSQASEDSEVCFLERISVEQQLEFTKFDGNPQTLRLVTRLQTHAYGLGLDLSAATLAAMLKYPVSAKNRNKKKPAHKKVGYFETERDIVEWIRNETGLKEGQRHPLTWIMEACDDVAYSILDVDDVMKKGIASPEDILSQMGAEEALKNHACVEKIKNAFGRVDAAKHSVFVARDIKIGYMRAYLMEALLDEAANNFIDNAKDIFSFKDGILPILEESDLCNFLKEVAKDHAFSNPGVLKSEAIGAQAITEIMSFFWASIVNREEVGDIKSRRTTAASKFAWSLVSPNYIEEAARCIKEGTPPQRIRYAEMRLLTDMVSGMTDSFSMKLWSDIQALPKC
ncbi:dGTP triphosphohydrolase [Paenirhodobacter sp. CAU 1674]|uniref:deoxyguanosinetriphosphate triphosphohydrolase family protein n=1 Tax=Paenirhodobacter sp. CAU 1674 TaxID=3032596 RepID=UPI0023DC95C3|nr:dNTP triphosphohydrolase [Paenirhodobacter sp. CAU 1674]MDF2143263.1 dNTP triphosphohydrolase [Paenirhodobacter sp. CAU 1674]